MKQSDVEIKQHIENKICIVTTVREEASSLNEWIAYHRIIGVGHFILYAQDRHLGLHDHLQGFGDKVTIVDWYKESSKQNQKLVAYQDSICRIPSDYSWIAFLDTDEFIALRLHNSMAEFLREFSSFGQVSLHRHVFGHNGLFDNPRGLVTATLTKRMARIGTKFRSIVQRNAIQKISDPHLCELKQGYLHVDANKQPFESLIYPGKTDVAHINHYPCRSFTDWMEQADRVSIDDILEDLQDSWRYSKEGCLRQFVEIIAKDRNEISDVHMVQYKTMIDHYLAELGILHSESQSYPHNLFSPAQSITHSMVVYTAITSGYDILQPVDSSIDHIAFLEDALPVTGWKTCPLERRCNDENRNSKIYKILPHVFFPGKEYSLWLDGSISINVKPEELLEMYMKDFDMLVHRHPERNCVFEEAITCYRKSLDDRQIIIAQMTRYQREAYPSCAGLFENGVILRRHNRRVKAFNELWWEEIQRGSRRDQLSAPYVARRVGLKVGYFPGTLRKEHPNYNGLFNLNEHLK